MAVGQPAGGQLGQFQIFCLFRIRGAWGKHTVDLRSTQRQDAQTEYSSFSGYCPSFPSMQRQRDLMVQPALCHCCCAQTLLEAALGTAEEQDGMVQWQSGPECDLLYYCRDMSSLRE
jgi:hypothetical protein